MVLYYALGGGLGHLTRARRVLDALGWSGDAVLLTASRYARDPRVTGGLPVERVPARLGHDRGAFREWLQRRLDELAPDELFVDSFPGGILGELCGMALPPVTGVARRLRWDVYAQRLDGPLPAYTVTHVLEPLAAEHARVLADCSERVLELELPVPAPSFADRSPVWAGPHWLVVHSGPDAEVVDLAVRATRLAAEAGDDVQIVVISPRVPSSLPQGAVWRDVYPVAPYFGQAEKIITAAGFNAMQETLHVRDRHLFVPYPRPLDDQNLRAAQRRREIFRPHV